MTNEHVGLYAKRHEQFCLGIADHKQGRLGDPGLVDSYRGLLFTVGRREKHRADVKAELGFENLSTRVDGLFENLLRLIERQSHPDKLVSLPWKHENNRFTAVVFNGGGCTVANLG